MASVFFLVAAVAIWPLVTQAPLGLDDERVGQRAPDIFAVPLERATDVERISPFTTDGPTLIDFWNLNCTPCRHNRPAITRVLTDSPHVRGLSVNIDPETAQRRSLVAAYAEEFDVRGDVLLDRRQTREAWQANAAPILFVVDEGGEIRRVLQGRIRARDLRRVLHELDAAP